MKVVLITVLIDNEQIGFGHTYPECAPTRYCVGKGPNLTEPLGNNNKIYTKICDL
jgi:hypothetical protein